MRYYGNIQWRHFHPIWFIPILFTATIANENKTPLFKIKSWQKQGKVLPEVFNIYKEVKADLNVLPFCIQFIPMDIINHPRLKSICYHPSILPKHRGVSAISW